MQPFVTTGEYTNHESILCRLPFDGLQGSTKIRSGVQNERNLDTSITMYYPHYVVSKEESRGRYSKDPKLRDEYARLYSPTKLCHEILKLETRQEG